VDRKNTVDLNELGLDTHDLTELDLPFTEEGSMENYRAAASG
jgi:hypothetical protein